MAADIGQQISKIWDEDAAAYDETHDHVPLRPHEVAAWRATLRRLLPDPPAAVLDAGAGTGFISLILAGQGYEVTAVDFSEQMLAVLKSKAARLGLNVNVVQADVADLPGGQAFERRRRAGHHVDVARPGRGAERMANGSPRRPSGAHRGDVGQEGERGVGRAVQGRPGYRPDPASDGTSGVLPP